MHVTCLSNKSTNQRYDLFFLWKRKYGLKRINPCWNSTFAPNFLPNKNSILMCIQFGHLLQIQIWINALLVHINHWNHETLGITIDEEVLLRIL